MSRRYGRNQKRRARAAIERLQATEQALRDEMATARHSAERWREKALSLQGKVELTAKILGTNFVGVEEKLLEIGDADLRERFRHPVGDSIVYMHTMRVDVRDSTRPDHLMHALVSLGGECVAYSISEPTIRWLEPQDLCQLIGPQIARMLVPRLKALYPKSATTRGGW